MNQGIEQITKLIGHGIEIIIAFFQIAWKWSFGEVMVMFNTHLPRFELLHVWQQILLIIVTLAILYIAYLVFRDVLNAVLSILRGFTLLIRAIIDNIFPIIIAGLIAFGGSWAINNLTIAWLP